MSFGRVHQVRLRLYRHQWPDRRPWLGCSSMDSLAMMTRATAGRETQAPLREDPHAAIVLQSRSEEGGH